MSNTLGCVFPGQGSQSPGMLTTHFERLEPFNYVFDCAKEVLDIDFKLLIEEASAEDLAKTEITQPLLLTSNFALWKSLNKSAENIAVMAGHSLGEFSAYVAAESLSFEDALVLVSLRAKFMQEAVKEGEGGIAAILGLTYEKLLKICEDVSKDGDLVSMANLNSENQIVVSGTRVGVEKAIELSKESGAKRAVPLAMSVPSHSQLMKPASVQFAEELSKVQFNQPKTKVIQNFSVDHSDEPEVIKNNLVSQLYSPVRWNETMSLFNKNGISSLIECGPGKVLTGLIKRQFKDINPLNLDDFETLSNIRND